MAQADTKFPLTGFTGQQSQVRFITRSHGAIKPNLGQDLTITPKGTNKVVGEYGNLLPALIYQVYESVSGKLAYNRNNQRQLEALLMDSDPTALQSVVTPTGMQTFNVLQNLKGKDSLIKASTLTLGCVATPSPFSGKLMDIAQGSIDFNGITHYEFPGFALQYVRATLGTPLAGQPAAPTLAVLGSGGTLGVGTYYVRITAITAAGESQGSQEAFIRISSLSVNTINVTTPAPAGAITAYKVYFSNLSGAEADTGISGNGSGTPLAITALPPSSAALCPNIDTSGAFAATGDLVFAGGGPATITLPQPAVMIPTPAGGQMYAAVFQNGNMVGNLENPSNLADWAINTAGTQFSLRLPPAAGDWWDIFTVYKP